VVRALDTAHTAAAIGSSFRFFFRGNRAGREGIDEDEIEVPMPAVITAKRPHQAERKNQNLQSPAPVGSPHIETPAVRAAANGNPSRMSCSHLPPENANARPFRRSTRPRAGGASAGEAAVSANRRHGLASSAAIGRGTQRSHIGRGRTEALISIRARNLTFPPCSLPASITTCCAAGRTRRTRGASARLFETKAAFAESATARSPDACELARGRLILACRTAL
jgi:hypothetical protein